MGATPSEDLALNFLEALADQWRQDCQVHVVKQEDADLLRALGQITLRALAASARELRKDLTRTVSGQVIAGVDELDPATALAARNVQIPLRDALNKVVHGEPAWVVGTGSDLLMGFKYIPPYDARDGEERYFSWFSGMQVLEGLRQALYSHENRRYQVKQFRELIDMLGSHRLFPSQATGRAPRY